MQFAIGGANCNVFTECKFSENDDLDIVPNKTQITGIDHLPMMQRTEEKIVSFVDVKLFKIHASALKEKPVPGFHLTRKQERELKL